MTEPSRFKSNRNEKILDRKSLRSGELPIIVCLSPPRCGPCVVLLSTLPKWIQLPLHYPHPTIDEPETEKETAGQSLQSIECELRSVMVHNLMDRSIEIVYYMQSTERTLTRIMDSGSQKSLSPA